MNCKITESTKFKKGTTLKQVMDELKENKCVAIIRILPKDNGYVFEYEVEDE